MELILSKKEKELYEFLKEKNIVTIKEIEEKLSLSHVGAVGRLVGHKIIEKVRKRRDGEYKMTTYYRIKETPEEK